MTLKTILDSLPCLKKLYQTSLPAVASYSIMKNIKMIDEENLDFQKINLNLLQKYATLDGDKYSFSNEENQKEYYKELAALLDTKVELNIRKIQLEDLKNINITPEELLTIDYMIEESE